MPTTQNLPPAVLEYHADMVNPPALTVSDGVPAPTLSGVRKHSGVAGAYEYAVDVTYPGESSGRVSFVASIYGGPVVMVTPGGAQVFVSSDVTDRLGTTITEAWLCAFFGVDRIV